MLPALLAQQATGATELNRSLVYGVNDVRLIASLE
jgi:hypothetical protein